MSDAVGDAAAALRAGGLVVLPTDTVHGIAARPDDPLATQRLFDAKARPRELELPVLVPDLAAAERIAVFDGRARTLAARYWPGPLTLVLPRDRASSGWDLGGDPGTIGVRVPRHPLALAVLGMSGPLAVTSANRSGEPTPTDCGSIVEAFGDSVEVYLCDEGPLSGQASTVLDLAHGEPRILREGALSEGELRAAIGLA